MSHYTTAIIKWGLVIPLIFAGILLGIAYYSYDSFTAENQLRKQRQDDIDAKQLSVNTLKESTDKRKDRFNEQCQMLNSDPADTYNKLADYLKERFKPIELEKESITITSSKSAAASASKVASTNIEGVFQGGMGPIQETLLTIDSFMPNSILEQFKVVRQSNRDGGGQETLKLNFTHLIWKSAEATQ
jgi:hypothetical protein